MNFARLTSLLATLALFLLGLAFVAVAVVMLSGVYQGAGFPVDFSAFWAEGQLVWQGRGVEGFDKTTLNDTIALDPDYLQTQYLWLYPPTWAAAVAPLGLLPFWMAWPLFSGFCLWAFLRVLNGPAAALPGGANLLLAAPVAVMGTLNGNNGLLSAAVLVLALGALDAGRSVRGGLLIAALTMKPTLGLLIPFAMAAAGWWRGILMASIGAIALALAALALLGPAMWLAWFEVLGSSAQLIDGGGVKTHVMVSWYGFARSTGADHVSALVLQGAITLALIGLVIWLFRGNRPTYLRNAVFLMAVPLATPYAHYYEMALTLAGLVFWVASGAGKHWIDRILLAGTWLVPIFGVITRDPPLVALIAPPLSTLTLLVALRTGKWA
ncbi:MAG: glycosyltransferase family 87 protein [Pseudomonadota bacterium]